MKKVAMFEKLKRGMLEEIRVKVCDFLINDCDICPKFISSRCQENCNDNDKEAEEAREGDEDNDEGRPKGMD